MPAAPIGVHSTSDLKVLHGPVYEGGPAAGSWDLKLHGDDDAGVDWMGADEITVNCRGDNAFTAQVTDNDADTGE